MNHAVDLTGCGINRQTAKLEYERCDARLDFPAAGLLDDSPR